MLLRHLATRAAASTCSAVPPRNALGGSGVLRRLSTTPPTPPASSAQASRPTEAEVKNLAEAARIQGKMWAIFVPEKGVRIGDQRFWTLLIIVFGLHTFANYRESQRGVETDLPEGVARRLPDGRLLMIDGSITAKGVDDSSKAPTLHKVKEAPGGVINNLVRSVKDAV